MKNILKYYMGYGLVVIILALSACGDLYETHEKYLKMAEETYIGLADSLTANGGFNRIQLKWQLNADPKISTCVISWNGAEKPLELAADRSGKFMSTIIDLAEGKYIFTVVIKSDSGKESLPRTVSGEVYGTNYQSRLPQRGMKSIKNTGTNIIIQWAPEEGCVGVNLIYMSKDGNEQHLFVDGEEDTTIIEDAVPGSEFVQISLFKPEIEAIDNIESLPVTRQFPD